MFPKQSEAEVFFTTNVIWAILPFFASFSCVFVWFAVSKCTEVDMLQQKMKASVVALLHLLWPSICSQTFAIFACREVCGKSMLRADLDEPCWGGGRHSDFATFLGIPMLILYVIGLPLFALIMVIRLQRRAILQKKEIHELKGHYVWGLFFSVYRPQIWWWEVTVTIRKITVAAIGVFGVSMGDFQVHFTAFLMVGVLAITAVVHPYGEHKMLQWIELSTVGATWMTLWAGTVFNSLPRCEDGKGGTVGWCIFLSIVIGILNLVCVVLVVTIFVIYKRRAAAAAKAAAAAEAEAVASAAVAAAVAAVAAGAVKMLPSNPLYSPKLLTRFPKNKSKKNTKKQTRNKLKEDKEGEDINEEAKVPQKKKERRLSSRELMKKHAAAPEKKQLEMVTLNVKNNTDIEEHHSSSGESKNQKEATAVVTQRRSSYWKYTDDNGDTYYQSELDSSETTWVLPEGAEVLSDPISDNEHEDEQPPMITEIQVKVTTDQKYMSKRNSFRKIESNEGIYYENQETFEMTWELPENGILMDEDE